MLRNLRYRPTFDWLDSLEKNFFFIVDKFNDNFCHTNPDFLSCLQHEVRRHRLRRPCGNCCRACPSQHDGQCHRGQLHCCLQEDRVSSHRLPLQYHNHTILAMQAMEALATSLGRTIVSNRATSAMKIELKSLIPGAIDCTEWSLSFLSLIHI